MEEKEQISIFSLRIKELRESLGLSQSEFAKSVGTTQTTLSSYENTNKTPSLEIVKAIAEKYNVSIDWLCGLSEKKSPSTAIETYSDLFAFFLELNNISSLETLFGKKEKLENENVPFSDNYMVAYLDIDDSNVVSFFDEWIDIIKICSKSASGEKLYSIWKKDILEQYNKPFEPKTHDSIELPFN